MMNQHTQSRKLVALISLAVFAITFIIYYLTKEESNPYNSFVLLADAFLHGRLYLIEDATWLELIHVGDKHFVVPPPMPAILSLPAVAIWGAQTSQMVISIFFGSINVALAYLAARQLTKSVSVQIWTTAMFGFGTIHWWVATSGSVWTFSQTISVTFLFIAILLTLHHRNSFLIGLSLGASYWCRLTTVLSLPFFLIYTYDRWYKPFNLRSLFSRLNIRFLFFLGLGIAIFIILNGLYNFARFGTPFDVSYYLIPEIFDEPWYQKGIFDITYIPRHLNIIFAKFPAFIDEYPYMIPNWHGLAIWITTPAFIYAFRSGIRNKLSLGCWVSILLIALINFSHGTWGFVQFGYRFAVDFYPFLFLLTVRGIGEQIRWHHKVLIIFGILVNLWGVLLIQEYGWIELGEMFDR
ncbi:MAG: hypothetical protein AAF462_09360 [Thermodesulfobacteriota bacterium]